MGTIRSMCLRGGSFRRVFMLALALVLAMRLSTPPQGEEEVSAAQVRSPFLGKALGHFFEGASRLVLESAGFLDRKVEEKVSHIQDRWTGIAARVEGKLSGWAATMSSVFFKSSPLAGLKALGDRACDGILDLMGRTLTWASCGGAPPTGRTKAQAGASLPPGGTPALSGAPGLGRE